MILFFFIKIIIIPVKKISTYKIASHPITISKQEKETIQECIKNLQSNPVWITPLSATPLFISRNYFSKNNILVDPTEYNKQLFPPLHNEWILKYHLDYSNPNILSEDPSGDGFTNLEKWLGNDPYKNPGSISFDPNDPKSRPLLWTKLRCYSNNLYKKNYYFYFIGVDDDSSELVFILQLEELTSNSRSQGKATLATKIKHFRLGEVLQEIPLQIINFKKEKTIYKEINYDTSTLTVVNTETKKEWTLIKKSRLHPTPTMMDVLENVSLEYTLESPPRKINLKYGDVFLLESLQLGNVPDHKDQEFYKLIRVDDHEVLLEREGCQYAIPILSTPSGN
ncbi:MAG: hypothetical protein K2W99_02380 [Chthoniobacterales bacterium]|nr:hypothetical protein [Chthoniobacterales bacterium]